MGTDATSAPALLGRAEAAWADGDGEAAIALFGRAAELAEAAGDLDTRVAAVLGLARGQEYNLTPGLLPVRLHAAYDATDDVADRSRLAAALARCWSYANEPTRARPFGAKALELAERSGDPVLLADALDAALAAHWGPDDLPARREWAVRLDDAAAHLADPDARLQAQLWTLTVAWEVLDLSRMHRAIRAIEVLAEESVRARFFAASRRLPLELLRAHLDVAPALIAQAEAALQVAVIPDADGILHNMRGYTAYFSGDTVTCAREAVAFEDYAVAQGVAVVRAEAAVVWLGAGRLDKVAEMIGSFTPDVLSDLPRDNDWLLTVQCVLEGAVAVADRVVASAAVALLRPYAGRSVVNAGAVMWHGVTDDTLARALALLGDADGAEQHRLAALATYERIGAAWWRDRLGLQLPGGPVADDAERVVHLQPQANGVWLLGRAGATFVMPRTRGLEHLHALVSRPHTEVSALSLVGGEVVEQPGLDVLDDQARRLYRSRLAELDAEISAEEATGWSDEGRVQGLRDEYDALADQLRGATGLAGRSRTSGSSDERARVAVRKAIVATLARIAEADPWLGRHLHATIHTGLGCRYEPDPDQPVRWVLSS